VLLQVSFTSSTEATTALYKLGKRITKVGIMAAQFLHHIDGISTEQAR
jgi:hypothetical protein